MIFVLKSRIENYVTKKVTRSVKKACDKLRIKHHDEIKLYKRALKDKEQQHLNDILALEKLREERDYNAYLAATAAPILQKVLEEIGVLKGKIEYAEWKKHYYAKQEIKAKKLLRVVG